LRIGRLAPSATGKFLLDKSPGKALETCVRVASSPLSCVSAYAGSDDEEAWVSLPLTATSADLLAGITVQLRFVGDEDPMAEWRYPVESSVAVLCNGLAVKLKLPDGEIVGSLSMFLDDAYYVELGRGKLPSELTRRLSTLQFKGASPNLFETDAVESNRYALSIGPVDKATAEAAKWSVLRQGGDAKIVLGFDYRGRAPRTNSE
jgi:hypothetical protein